MSRKPGKVQQALLTELSSRDVPLVRRESHTLSRTHHSISIKWAWNGEARDWRDSTVNAIVRNGWAEYVVGVEGGARRKSKALRITPAGRVAAGGAE